MDALDVIAALAAGYLVGNLAGRFGMWVVGRFEHRSTLQPDRANAEVAS